uniref:Uncharacterized protein n=1 Tax=Hucho hucho TaxID=62062 RepID=A0A4W5QXQ8_9TELE
MSSPAKDSGLQSSVCALLSMLWVCELSPVPAYQKDSPPSLPDLAKRLSPCYSPQVQAECVLLLSLLRGDVCVSVCSQALESPHEVVRASAVRSFPLLLHHMGHTHHNLTHTTLMEEVQDYLPEIYFLPDHPELKDIHTVLQDYKKLTSRTSDLAAGLQFSMRAVQHENLDVRVHALTSLKDMIHSNQEWVLQQVCVSEAVEPVISSLVLVLLRGCQDFFPNGQAAVCLFELGAVDPGQLDLSHTHTHTAAATSS